VQALKLAAGTGPGGVGAVGGGVGLNDPGQQQGQPAEQHVSADAVFERP
jgi:hypothetical protein